MPLRVKYRYSIILWGLFLVGWGNSAWAISARLIPEDKWRVRIFHNEGHADNWLDHSGEKHSLGLNGLSLLQQQGVAPRLDPVYEILNRAQYDQSRTDVTIDYGVNDDLTVAAWLRYFEQGTEQKTTLKKHLGWGQLEPHQQNAIVASVNRLNNTDPGASAWGDLLLGFKYRILGSNRDIFRLSLGAGVRMPTGHVADPRKPQDMSTGDGQWDFTLMSWMDYQFSEHFFVNLHSRHDFAFAANKDALVPGASGSVDSLRFKPGISHHVQLEPQYRLPFTHWELLLGMQLIYDYQGDLQQQSFDLERQKYTGKLHRVDDSDWQRLMIKPSIGISLLKQKIPLRAYLGFHKTVWGENTLDYQSIEFRVEVFFNTL